MDKEREQEQYDGDYRMYFTIAELLYEMGQQKAREARGLGKDRGEGYTEAFKAAEEAVQKLSPYF